VAWVYLVIASFGEIFGMASINLYIRKRTIPRLLLIIATFGFGFFFLSLAMRALSMGTSYAVWTGLGAAGAVMVGILFFKEEVSWQRNLFLGCIITPTCFIVTKLRSPATQAP
jgi:paired small multidrug resistance pump